MAHSLCGTASYLAPELLDGIPYNGKVDLWAIGVLLYCNGYFFFIVPSDSIEWCLKNTHLVRRNFKEWIQLFLI